MKRWCLTAVSAMLVAVAVGASPAHAAAPGVRVNVLTRFPAGENPAAVAATNPLDVVALAGPKVVYVTPTGAQVPLTTISGGAFGTAIGISYDVFHQLYVALPETLAP